MSKSSASSLPIIVCTLILAVALFGLGMIGYQPVMEFILAGNVSSFMHFNYETQSVHRLISAIALTIPGIIVGVSALWCCKTLKSRFVVFVFLTFIACITLFIRVFFIRYDLNSVSRTITSTAVLPVDVIQLYTLGAYAGIAVFLFACILRWTIQRSQLQTTASE